MAADATLRLNIQVANADSVKKALNGVVTETKKAQAEIQKAQGKTDKDLDASVRRNLRNQQDSARRSADAVRRAEQDKRAEVAKTARETQRSLATTLREAAKQTKDFISRNRAIFGGIAAGGAFALSQARGIAGTPSTQEGVQGALEFSRNLIRLRSELNLTGDGLSQLQESILKASSASLQSSNSFLSAIDAAQQSFQRSDFIRENLEFLGKAATDAGGSVEDLVNPVGLLVQNFKLASKDVPSAVGLIKETGLNIKQFGDVYGKTIDDFVKATGATGRAGLGQLFGTVKTLRAGGAVTEKDARAQLQAILDTINNPDALKTVLSGTSQGFRKSVSETGNVSLPGLINELAANKNIDQGSLRTVLGKQAGGGFQTLISQARANGGISAIGNAGAGAEGINAILATSRGLSASGAGQIAKSNIDIQNEYIKNSQNVTKASLLLAGSIGKLEAQFPLATVALGTFTTALVSSAAIIALLGKGGAAGAGAGILGGIARGGAAIGGALFSVPAAIGVGGAALAAGAYYVSNRATGGTDSAPSSRGLHPAGRALEHQNTKSTEANTAELRALNQNFTKYFNVDLGYTR